MMKPALSVLLLMQVAVTDAWNPVHKKHHDEPKATPVVTPDATTATTDDKPEHHFEEEKPKVNPLAQYFDPEHPHVHVAGLTEFTVYHFVVGFMSGVYGRDVEHEWITCFTDLGEFQEAIQLIEDIVH